MTAPRPKTVTLDPLKPSSTLLVKLGSMIVHAEELAAYGRHPVDWVALDTLRKDPEVVAWLAAMSKLALLPVKR
jgi:hypothetical protein